MINIIYLLQQIDKLESRIEKLNNDNSELIKLQEVEFEFTGKNYAKNSSVLKKNNQNIKETNYLN